MFGIISVRGNLKPKMRIMPCPAVKVAEQINLANRQRPRKLLRYFVFMMVVLAMGEAI